MTGANSQEASASNVQGMDEEDEDFDAGESNSQSWTEEDDEEILSKSTHPSVEDSRMMKEGGEKSDREKAEMRRPSLQSETSSKTAVKRTEKEMLETMTQPRFRHVQTEHGHMVVTGRDGEIQRCEDEPIHIPGAVQSFGCMVVVREDEEGVLVVRQVSEVSGKTNKRKHWAIPVVGLISIHSIILYTEHW